MAAAAACRSEGKHTGDVVGVKASTHGAKQCAIYDSGQHQRCYERQSRGRRAAGPPLRLTSTTRLHLELVNGMLLLALTGDVVGVKAMAVAQQDLLEDAERSVEVHVVAHALGLAAEDGRVRAKARLKLLLRQQVHPQHLRRQRHTIDISAWLLKAAAAICCSVPTGGGLY